MNDAEKTTEASLERTAVFQIPQYEIQEAPDLF